LPKVPSGYPERLRGLLYRQGLDGSILGFLHPAHLVTSVASHPGLDRSNVSRTNMIQGACKGKAGTFPVHTIHQYSL
jgi:hypothetical protein